MKADNGNNGKNLKYDTLFAIMYGPDVITKEPRLC